MDESISTFVSITGASADVARGFVQLAGGDFERAVGLYFENPDLVSGVGAGISGGSDPPPLPTSERPRLGRQDSTGVIHISDDDEGAMHIDDDDYDDEDDTRALQEEEDAAMAQRLQEELYQGGQGDNDGVRAPIARTTETLIAPDPAWGGDDEDISSAFLEEMRRRRPPPPRSGGPFGQGIWGDGSGGASSTTENGSHARRLEDLFPRSGGPFGQGIWGDGSGGASSTTENGSHARRLEDLFRPPYELMTRAPWDEARTLGKEDKKWLLVNLQDMNDFNCQALNRDIWKDQAVRDLIEENFIFMQYDKDYPDAEEYLTFYLPHRSHENPDMYPHVSIVDPRTGEQVKVWSGRPFPSASEFHAELAEFLDRYSLAANSKNPVAKPATRRRQPVDVDRMTEEEMLEMALKNSLVSDGGGGEAAEASTNNLDDPDALTKSPDPLAAAETMGKGKEPATTTSPFESISSHKPHTEPEPEPTSTTRIQFKHPDGRVIRRFRLADPVRRIYEWLKAEPLAAGKEGVPFELKRMPQGQDLLSCLDMTVGETGLKQGTVMVEFIED
ncbi:hypothetical protein L249_8592 [Ophiocordyceps polyrhachis-furcata BCC 54312]|uniref:UBX domain-containing protein n=1 Tax=Ophiocordyceps polyrhachis-furcata BCC 54312 TaxID=1330021 RepID=A0A367L6V0_9HYPO|nr:hypothetical protein L249_8592 [Ophiocordyceps polyrhachis-furcata BCC 54312]